MSRKEVLSSNNDGSNRDDDATNDAQAPDWIRWKRGVELPPFTNTNPAAVQLCLQIVHGTTQHVPKIDISEAVAVQIYQLICDSTVRAEELKDCGIGGVYVILASLARGALVAPDAAAAKRLRVVLARKSSSHDPPGLDVALRIKARM